MLAEEPSGAQLKAFGLRGRSLCFGFQGFGCLGSLGEVGGGLPGIGLSRTEFPGLCKGA